MSVERRYSARHPVDFEVRIRFRRRRFLSARARDLSAEGLYLDVRNLTLPCGILIELELSHRGRDWLIPAVVIHASGSGIGLMFRNLQPELFRDSVKLRPLAPPPDQRSHVDEHQARQGAR
jgi:hypothetical protein